VPCQGGGYEACSADDVDGAREAEECSNGTPLHRGLRPPKALDQPRAIN